MLLKKILDAASVNSLISTLVNFTFYSLFMRQAIQIDKKMEDLARTRNKSSWPFLTVLVPARNEEATIEGCLTSILNQDYPNFEVIVIDDNSQDATPQILADLAGQYCEQLKVVTLALPLPEYWTGKNNALWQGYSRVVSKNSEWLLFVDSDSRLQQGALRGGISYCKDQNLDLLSLAAGYYGGFWHRLLLVELSKLYFLGAFSINPHAESNVTAVGAFLLARREAYDKSGGHKAVCHEVIEDAALARSFRRSGFTTLVSSASSFVRQEPEASLKAFWLSMSKNWFLVARGSWARVAFLTLYQSYNFLPFIRVAFGLAGKERKVRTFDLATIGIMLLTYSQMLQSYKAPRSYALLYPLAVLIDTLIILDSAVRIGLFRKVSWRDREIKNPLRKPR
ncbi:MAG TPA: glycosyltransferase [Chloroflexia bacterium]|nr:glycosyltransferase [Chloroflexia bacterium]